MTRDLSILTFKKAFQTGQAFASKNSPLAYRKMRKLFISFHCGIVAAIVAQETLEHDSTVSFIYIIIHHYCRQHTSSSSSPLGFGAPPLAVLHFLPVFLSCHFCRSSGSKVVPSLSQRSQQFLEVPPLP